MKVVVALDSFKGEMTSFEVGQAARKGILQADPEANVSVVQVVDAGDDNMTMFKSSEKIVDEFHIRTTNIIGRPIKSGYLMLTFKRAPMAIIETRDTAGIEMVERPSAETFEKSTSYGLGTQIRDALDRGVKRIVVFTGNSAINDGGLGMLQAMGLAFFDKDGHLIGKDHNLLDTDFKSIEGVDDLVNRYERVEITIASDVETMYAGLDGVQAVYGNMLGGTKQQIAKFDRKMQEFQNIAGEIADVDLSIVKGAGADGGIGGALALLGGEIKPSFEVMAWLTSLQRQMAGADLIVVGSGDLDLETQQGKTAYRVAQLAKELEVPIVAIGSKIDKNVDHFAEMNIPVFSTQSRPDVPKWGLSRRESARNVSALLKNTLNLMNIAKDWEIL